MKKHIKRPSKEQPVEKLFGIEKFATFRDFISKESNKDVIIRIPVTAVFGESKVFGPDHYFLGDFDEAGDQIDLSLNDTRMGIGLQSELMSYCEEDLCEFWVDVQWQGMDGEHSKINNEQKYAVMALKFIPSSPDLDRKFVYGY